MSYNLGKFELKDGNLMLICEELGHSNDSKKIIVSPTLRRIWENNVNIFQKLLADFPNIRTISLISENTYELDYEALSLVGRSHFNGNGNASELIKAINLYSPQSFDLIASRFGLVIIEDKFYILYLA